MEYQIKDAMEEISKIRNDVSNIQYRLIAMDSSNTTWRWLSFFAIVGLYVLIWCRR